MKKMIFLLLGIILCFSVILCISICSCMSPNLKTDIDSNKDRFCIIEGSYESQAILVDTETGVEYLWVHPGSYNGGLTVLVDNKGNPLIAPGFKDY